MACFAVVFANRATCMAARCKRGKRDCFALCAANGGISLQLVHTCLKYLLEFFNIFLSFSYSLLWLLFFLLTLCRDGFNLTCRICCLEKLFPKCFFFHLGFSKWRRQECVFFHRKAFYFFLFFRGYCLHDAASKEALAVFNKTCLFNSFEL